MRLKGKNILDKPVLRPDELKQTKKMLTKAQYVKRGFFQGIKKIYSLISEIISSEI